MAKVVNMPSREVIRSITGRKRRKHPKGRDVSMNQPHVIDWEKTGEAIRNMSKEEIEALIQASHGNSGGID